MTGGECPDRTRPNTSKLLCRIEVVFYNANNDTTTGSSTGIGELSSQGRAFEAYYFRTSDQYELDLGRERWAVEIKLTTSPGPEDMARLDRAADLIGASRRLLVSQVGKSTDGLERASCNLKGLIERLRQLPG